MQNKDRKELVQSVAHIFRLLSQEEKNQVLQQQNLPISIFRSNLSGLEAITYYLKKTHSVKEIAALLNRASSTIYTTYKKAQQKLTGSFDDTDFSISIPIEIFTDRKLSVLESLISHLKQEHKLSLVKIAKLLNKNYGTVKTVHRRYKNKCH